MISAAAISALLIHQLSPEARQNLQDVYEQRYDFTCPVIGPEGESMATLSGVVRYPQRLENEEDTPVVFSIISDNPIFPDVVEIRWPEDRLYSGQSGLTISPEYSDPWPAPQPLRTSYKFVIPPSRHRTNGYIIVSNNTGGSHFEIASFQPVAAGICRIGNSYIHRITPEEVQ